MWKLRAWCSGLTHYFSNIFFLRPSFSKISTFSFLENPSVDFQIIIGWCKKTRPTLHANQTTPKSLIFTEPKIAGTPMNVSTFMHLKGNHNVGAHTKNRIFSWTCLQCKFFTYVKKLLNFFNYFNFKELILEEIILFFDLVFAFH